MEPFDIDLVRSNTSAKIQNIIDSLLAFEAALDAYHQDPIGRLRPIEVLLEVNIADESVEGGDK